LAAILAHQENTDGCVKKKRIYLAQTIMFGGVTHTYNRLPQKFFNVSLPIFGSHYMG